MSTPTVPCLQLIERAYSYLRLSGASEADCCRHVQTLAGALAEAMVQDAPPAELVASLWQQLMADGVATQNAQADAPMRAPAPVRGSIGYARFGGARRS